MFIKPSFIRTDKRGSFVEAINGFAWRDIIYGVMKKGAVMGNHYHKKTKVFFFLIEGVAIIDTINVKNGEFTSMEIKENEGVFLSPYFSHAVRFQKKSIFIMGKERPYDKKNPDTYDHHVSSSARNFL